MQVGCRDERMNARASRVSQRPYRAVNIAWGTSRQRGDDWTFHGGSDVTDGLCVGVGCDGEAGLDDVDTEPIELTRQPHFFVDPHREAGGLLAVAQSRVEND